uniref:Uncharacterized protein n=1 Tax=Moniliophthora roreri TaxID=221103 RepID=A0A0W0EYD8_MONRR
MWTIDHVEAPETVALWYSDGQPVIGTPRSGPAPASYHFMVQHRGFIDITVFTINQTAIDVNGARMHFENNLASASKIVHLSLVVHDQTSFSIMVPSDEHPFQVKRANKEIRASFKPFPHISSLDTSYMNQLITSNYVPYQTKPGKTDQEIRDSGLRLFPWTPHSYQLAMATYDWTTASFAC